MEGIIPKDEAEGLMHIKGEVRGIAIKSHGDFIKKEKGEEGLEKVEKTMASLGYPLDYSKLVPWGFYPVGLEILELLVIKKLFNFEDQKFEEIGAFGSRTSFILKIFFKYFGSIKKIAEKAPEIWKKYYTIGDLKVKTLDEKKKYIILALDNLFLHPIHCLHLKGYFSSVVKMVIGKNVNCEEIFCPHRGGQYHEFLIKW